MASAAAAIPTPHQQPSNDHSQKQDQEVSPNLYNMQQPVQPPPTNPILLQQQTNINTSNIPQFQPYLDTTQDTNQNINMNASSPSSNYEAYTGQQSTDESFTSFATPESSIGHTTRGFNMRYQLFLDQITPHWKARWAFSLTALVIFMVRVVFAQGWYVVCYALAIYYLNLFIGFISPRIDPSLNLGEDEDGPMLPTHASDEFKPFIRRLPEFKFWLSATQATLISLFLTLFEIFDIPVFWPILLLYFIILTACTLRQQIKHMIKWNYVPWNAGKKQYTGKGSGDGSNFSPTTV